MFFLLCWSWLLFVRILSLYLDTLIVACIVLFLAITSSALRCYADMYWIDCYLLFIACFILEKNKKQKTKEKRLIISSHVCFASLIFSIEFIKRDNGTRRELLKMKYFLIFLSFFFSLSPKKKKKIMS